MSGEGQLATLARQTAEEAGIRLNRVILAETLSLLLAAVENGDAAAVLPVPAISQLPQDRFAVVTLEKAGRLNREMVLLWSPEAAAQQSEVKRSVVALSSALHQAMADAARTGRTPGPT